MRRLLLGLLCLLLYAAAVGQPQTAAVAADDAPPEEKPPPPPVRQIYDVTDLITEPSVDMESVAVLPLTELGRREPPTAGSAQAQQSREPVTRTERIEQLIKLLEEMVDTDVWRDNGGSGGSIRTYETRLIVTAGAPTHDKLVELLADLRQSRGRSVRIRAMWAALSEDELQSVLVPTAETAARSAVRVVDPAAVERLKGAVRFRGEINCLNGQRVNLMAGRARSVLTQLEATIGTSAAAFAPTIELVLSGASLTVLPLVSADGSTVTLELRSVTGQWDKSDTPPIKIPLPVAESQPATNPSRPGTMDLERLNMPVQVVATAVRMPTRVAAVVGGMTADAELQHTDDHRPVYLIMEVWAEGSNQQHNHSD